MNFSKIRTSLFLNLAELINMPLPETITGTGARGKVGEWCKSKGYNNALIIASKSIIKYGVIDKLIESLDKEGIKYVIYDGVTPNPTFKSSQEAVDLGKKNNVDMVIVIGGGSPLDCSKLTAAALTNDKPIRKLAGMMKVGRKPLPIIAIPTTAGTGSEVTAAAVISDENTHVKHMMVSQKIVPELAVLDPETMVSLPKHVTAETTFDALDHAIEAYISTHKNEEAKKLAEEAIVLINDNLKKVYDNGDDLEGREALAIASYKAGASFNKCSLGYAHGFGHRFTELYDHSHGATLAMILPNLLDFNRKVSEYELATLAVLCGLGTKQEEPSILADKFIKRIYQLRDDVNLPTRCEGLKKADYDKIITTAFKESHRSYPVPRYMTKLDAIEFLNKLL
ncbi:iron-containing alcohol dehydrogenase [Clostridium cellulovorans]|uniref:Iron-containing alcohol dehydrogenase n=1 Tax=Clostridium cellulovorans (strain ATCC 35296 / DSM 3052 / OCM 3 / 743B) TaxID=573061 RepID=D9SMK2_CLOC7|nr:iron-containing alcohol dehydrogenase [Clostridium cellulovorans]ADL53858.1 iron-containing alcohol dehydrogenase [Clostridium cellulovorans 743B]